jgi:hypothetical protein
MCTQIDALLINDDDSVLKKEIEPQLHMKLKVAGDDASRN